MDKVQITDPSNTASSKTFKEESFRVVEPAGNVPHLPCHLTTETDPVSETSRLKKTMVSIQNNSHLCDNTPLSERSDSAP
jgi:hypothetical protein